MKKTILILGAGSDIVKATARVFAERGFSILLAGRSEEQMTRLQKDLNVRYASTVSIHYFDASDYQSHSSFINNLPNLPDIVLYAAGVMFDQESSEKDWRKIRNMIAVNYAGALSVLNLLAQLFKERGTGCIIGISSVAGDRGRGSNYLYGSTKAAFTAYLSGLRNHLYQKGISVLTVKPGFVYTKMTQNLPLPKLLTAQPEEVAAQLYRAVQKKKNVMYIRPVWRWIMLVIRILPEEIFKRTAL